MDPAHLPGQNKKHLTRWLLLACIAAMPARAAEAPPPPPDDTQFAAWVRAMKSEPLGPFQGVRWFCADGTIQPPREYACREHGGGRQSGQRDVRAETMRAAGIPLANVLSELTPEAALADDARLLKAALVEQFLVAIDDGWILRRARYVRGVFQAEDEAAAARGILLELARDPRVAEARYPLLREAVRLLPRPIASGSFTEVRALADELGRRDADFIDLRNLIHSRPAADQAQRVREHARRHAQDELRQGFETLARAIDAAFAHATLAAQLERSAAALGDSGLQALAARYHGSVDAQQQLETLTNILARIRDAMPGYTAARRLRAMELSLAAEDAAFAVARQPAGPGADSRRARLRALLPMVDGLYGSGLLTQRERRELRQALRTLTEAQAVSVGGYRDALAVLGRAPGWAMRRLSFHFQPMLRSFARVEPRAEDYIADRLHASLMLGYGERLEPLIADGDRLAGVQHELFGQPVSGGLRALNPGVARGPLRTLAEARDTGAELPIVLAAETTAELPAVAGILTESAGNALSHVQMLARNLGLPNVVVATQHLAALRRQLGTRIVLVASPGGTVRIAADGPDWEPWFPKAAQRPARIEVDTTRLDLELRRPVALAELRAADAGRIVGPKAAHLGELAARYPDQVSPALAIPFGVYRSLLDRTAPDGQQSMFDWLQLQHRLIAEIDDPAQRAAALRAFLQTARDWFAQVEFPAGLVDRLRTDAEALFGADGGYGVYVRSDTNLEDLPAFSGAGLNRTVPNVVGFDAVLDAIRNVWASPFTERAYSWRQLAMDRPEQVYVSVLLHKTVASEKSGVMVTADPDSGDPGTIFVSANEGAGGAVDGQSAESLRVRLVDGRVDLVASATEPTRRITLREGGLRDVPASGDDFLLTQAEMNQLMRLARDIPRNSPELRDAAGGPAPADVEFAFAGGRLYLLQMRPFLQGARAQRHVLLRALDASLVAARDNAVALDEPP
ncbi:PEP/pyruvate-binding domain-containing protein [Fontimonas sp. SYSU GA230001]|uniref:PEP/pyruvate-binding domain-containing protein n=1 Tax=Fontimonas sp. SYSU GA230001 TaxID=3142450 RepID=UPI0032B35D61